MIPENEVRDQLAANIDWFPLAEYCQIAMPDRKIDGSSLTGIIQEDVAGPNHETFYWKSGGRAEAPQWAIRHGPWKLLHNPMQAKKEELDADNLFLVHMEEDPGEQNNLSTSRPAVVEDLKKRYERWEEEVENQ